MKYKNPDGTMFKSVDSAFWDHCAKTVCCACRFDDVDKGSLCCVEWAEQNPNEVACLLGLEVIPEDRDNNNVPANDVTDINVGNKPLNEWTMAEVADYCNGRSCEECMFRKELRDDSVCGFKQNNPAFWRSLWTISFTSQEVEDAMALVRMFPVPFNTIKREENGDVILYTEKDGTMRWNGRISPNAFPSIKPGQIVKLSEIIGNPEV